jgi:hypothetical protein
VNHLDHLPVSTVVYIFWIAVALTTFFLARALWEVISSSSTTGLIDEFMTDIETNSHSVTLTVDSSPNRNESETTTQ